MRRFGSWITTPIALALAGLLLWRADLRGIAGAFGELSVGAAGGGLILYLLFNLAKAVRFRELLRGELPLRSLIPITMIYTFWSNLLPMRAGDLTYIYMLRSKGKVSIPKGISSLAVGTFFDVALTLLLLTGLGGVLRGDLRGRLPLLTLLLLPGGIVILLSALICLAVVGGSRVTPPSGGGFKGRVLGKLCETVAEMGRFSPSQLLFRVLPLSICLLLLRFSLQCYLIDRMGFRFGWVRSCFALAYTAFCNLLPIQGVGGLGTVEAPWSWALVGLGERAEEAIAAGFSLHGLIIGYAVICGGLGWISWRSTRGGVGSGTGS